MRRFIVTILPVALAGCGLAGQDNEKPAGDRTPEAAAPAEAVDPLASDDTAGADLGPADSEARPVMQAQVVLDRLGFAPGVIDGKEGMSTTNALQGFQEANELEVTGKLDDATKEKLAKWQSIPATRVVTVPESWGQDTYRAMPEAPQDQAALPALGYESLEERLAERFHTTVATLEMLNPGGIPAGMAQGAQATAQPTSAPPVATATAAGLRVRPGQRLRVPNIGGDRLEPGAIEDADWSRTLASLGVGSRQQEVDRIVVSKAKRTLRAYRGDRLVALFTVSSGSSEFPLPLGEWKILGEAYNPPYSYDPEVLGKKGTDGETHRLPPGPNSPVGVVWINLSKEHYGIHGTPDPETIGRAQSSGCVRLTNWDAARLALMVSPRTEVLFEA